MKLFFRSLLISAIPFWILSSGLFATEQAASETDNTKPYNLCIATIFKNEAEYIKEWIEYHLLVGVEHFYLYNNQSQDDFSAVLQPYIDNEIVTLIDWPDRSVRVTDENTAHWVACTQTSALDHACKLSASKTKWLALIDIDEYLIPIQSDDINDVLNKYASYPAITALWHMYGTSHVQTLSEDTLLMEVMHLTLRPEHDFNFITKTILQPDLYEKFVWTPHWCAYTNGLKAFYVNKDELRINHYTTRTIDYLYTHKIKNKEHMDGQQFSEQKIQEMLNFGNDVDEPYNPINRFIPQLRIKMGY